MQRSKDNYHAGPNSQAGLKESNYLMGTEKEETISRESEFSPEPVHGALSSQEDVTVSKEVMSACLRNGICMRDGEVKFAQDD